MSAPILRALEALLDREKTALLQGDYAQLAKTLPQKERLLQSLETIPPEKRSLMKVSQRLAHHQDLIAAALSGLKRAAAAPSPQVLHTYSPEGALSPPTSPQGRLEKRF